MDPVTKLYAFDLRLDNGASISIGTINLDILLSASSVKSVPVSQGLNFADKMLYMYTSGTSGLPKAVYTVEMITNQYFIILFSLPSYFMQVIIRNSR